MRLCDFSKYLIANYRMNTIIYHDETGNKQPYCLPLVQTVYITRHRPKSLLHFLITVQTKPNLRYVSVFCMSSLMYQQYNNDNKNYNIIL